MLAAHYDTKDIPDFVGANDGAGGTAAMLEIARVLSKIKRPKNAPPIRFVAFDGEEATDDSDFYGTGLRGSKPYARQARQAASAKLVLLDFIADKDLAIPREAELGRGDVGGPARAPPSRSARATSSRTRRRARCRTTTRRSCAAGCRRST